MSLRFLDDTFVFSASNELDATSAKKRRFIDRGAGEYDGSAIISLKVTRLQVETMGRKRRKRDMENGEPTTGHQNIVKVSRFIVGIWE